MNNRPYGNELLAAARRSLLDDLLPLLPAEKTYDALMIANAMSIAARELEPLTGHDAHESDAIQAFFVAAGLEGGQHNPTEETLAQLIRDRRLPAAHESGLHALLLSLTTRKLLRSNPKYLNQ